MIASDQGSRCSNSSSKSAPSASSRGRSSSSVRTLDLLAGQDPQHRRAVGAQPRRQRPLAGTHATPIGCTRCDPLTSESSELDVTKLALDRLKVSAGDGRRHISIGWASATLLRDR